MNCPDVLRLRAFYFARNIGESSEHLLARAKMITDYRIEKWSEAYPPNPAMLWLRLSQEGYSVQQWADLPNTFRGSQKFDHPRSHWIVKGTLEIDVEYLGRFVLGPGDRDFVPANAYHTARVVGDERVIFLVGELRSIGASEPARTKRGQTHIDPNEPPKKKRLTKAEKAAEEAEFERIKRMFGVK